MMSGRFSPRGRGDRPKGATHAAPRTRGTWRAPGTGRDRSALARRVLVAGLLILTGLLSVSVPAGAQETNPVTTAHGIAEFGDLKYGPDFTHFDYADPEAAKGGRLTLSDFPSYDSLNAVPVRVDAARSLPLLYDTLMVQSQDELSSYYGLVAETITYPEDKSFAEFRLRPEARWHDGQPITAGDVKFSFDAILEHGNPFLREILRDISAMTVVDDRTIRFDFATRDSIKPLLQVATLTLYPEHYWTAEGRDIGRATLDPPLGSGPYRIADAEAGRSITWQRVADYWAADLPVNTGLWNPDEIVYDYYRDRDIMFEAFKAGAFDFRRSYSSKDWSTGYDDLPAVDQGALIKEYVDGLVFRGMQGYFFNTRRPPFDNIRVREALSLLYPFEWVNENVMYSMYRRIETYFIGLDQFSAGGVPEGDELAVLEDYRGTVPARVFDEPYALPPGDPSDRRQFRQVRRQALALLTEAGFEVVDQRLVDTATGEPVTFEILLRSPALEPHTQAYARELERIGVDVTIRWVESAQFVRRYQSFDFDMISFAYAYQPPPGNELFSFFGSDAAGQEGSANIAGVRDPVVDDLIRRIVTERDFDAKAAVSRALDRVLLWGWYAVPNWRDPNIRIAYWDLFGRPQAAEPRFNWGFPVTFAFQPTWWLDSDKVTALER